MKGHAILGRAFTKLIEIHATLSALVRPGARSLGYVVATRISFSSAQPAGRARSHTCEQQLYLCDSKEVLSRCRHSSSLSPPPFLSLFLSLSLFSSLCVVPIPSRAPIIFLVFLFTSPLHPAPPHLPFRAPLFSGHVVIYSFNSGRLVVYLESSITCT